jgi:Cu/Ag efflux protein CusF
MRMRAIVFSLLALVATSAHSQTAASSHAEHHPPAPTASQAAASDFTEGEVRRVDRAAQKVTLRHGPIPNLEMPDMTMVFRVTDPAVLENLKPGDKVRFKADKVGGQYTVTQLEVVQ